jgi:hypothetical protein
MNESLAFANRMALRVLMKQWQGAWSEYQDFTVQIVPFETKFKQFRKFYKDQGVDLSKVPVILQKENKMLPVQYVLPKDLKKGEGLSGVSDDFNFFMLLGLGAVIAGLVVLSKGYGRRRGLGGTEEQHSKNVRDRIHTAKGFIYRATKNPKLAKKWLRHAIREIEFAKVEEIWLPKSSVESVDLRQTEKLAEELFKRLTG